MIGLMLIINKNIPMYIYKSEFVVSSPPDPVINNKLQMKWIRHGVTLMSMPCGARESLTK